MNKHPTLVKALEIGIQKSEQWKNGFIFRSEDGKLNACALGAIAIGSGLFPILDDPSEKICRQHDYGFAEKMYDVYPVLNRKIPGVTYSDGLPIPHTLRSFIIELNDVYKISREDILSWIKDLQEAGALQLEDPNA